MSAYPPAKMDTTAAEPATVKGWCPGALRPMLTGDGLIVRVRPRCGTLTSAQMTALADIARNYGNGLIDLTRRANLQLRGIDEHRIADVWKALSEIGLTDASAEAESVRNVMVSPLSGLDPSECLDVRPLAAALEKALAETPSLWALPGKFGFAVDGGGALPLDNERADIRLRAIHAETQPQIALGLDTPSGTQWMRQLDPNRAAHSAASLAEAFLRAHKPSPRARMRDLDPKALSALQNAVIDEGLPPDRTPLPNGTATARVGAIQIRQRIAAVGLGAPLGRLTADALAGLAKAASRIASDTVRLSPWRTLYVSTQNEAEAASLLASGQDLGLVVDPGDPLIAIDACPGTSACRSAWADTRHTARQIAAQMPLPGIGSVHVSGCAKGCARSQAADLVLVAGPAGFGIVRHGTAAGTPDAVVAPTALIDLPAVLRTGI
ncbi:precorrin-3B synthase [Hyphomicrobium nitrativorans NL23]|uniref:Precorrin-3B synthase n=1 Tax=Hyphomicrobium nitrativorans NL23 TaxID=1029756 RepID=V5SCJ2_9HYPH|nr:precorrin-3B synthase [Hyphomicrobium nitrativorans]AHB48207.1 precorrin-3B synthase [Hyphomicrobium nitrativorans NL23]